MEDKLDLFSKVPSSLTASEARDKLVKDQIEKERVATDTKTAKLKALRLAKEAADLAATPPPQPAGKRKRRSPSRI